MRSLLFLLLCCLFAGASAAEPAVWNYPDKDRIKFHTAPGNTWKTAVSETEKAPGGAPALALNITSSDPQAKPWHKQVNFLWTKAVDKGQKYRLTFHYKGSAPGEISYSAARASAPYTVLPKAGRTLAVTTGWQKEVREFTVDAPHPAPLAMPRFMAGNYPAGETLYLGPVTLERLDETFASLLSPGWKYAVESDGKLPVDRIPANTATAELKANSFRIGEPKTGASAVFYQEFEAPGDGAMTLGMAADWYFDCFVNGEAVFGTLKRGNLSHRFVPEDNIFNVPVKKGKNLIAVRVISGSDGWRFVCGKVPPVEGNPELAFLFKPEAGERFRPVDDSRFLEIKPGTALDFTTLIPREPAGTYGRVVVSPDGKPVFEKRPDVPVRFYSFNFMLGGMWHTRYHEWDKATIDRFADAVMRRGYNQVRLHIPESFLLGYEILTTYYRSPFADAAIPQTVAELEATLDMGNLDRFDYLIAAFKKRGIYVNLDLAGRRMIVRAYDVEHEDSFKAHLFHDEKFRNHWKVFTEYLMKRVNPYTGAAYKDEPAIMQICFINEQDLRFASGLKFLTASFRDYLRNKYKTDAALAAAWGVPLTFDTVPDITEADLRPGDRRAEDSGTFLIETMEEMTSWFYRTLREAGYPGLVNHWDMIMRTLELPARALLPSVAQHTYFAHPSRLPARGLISKNARQNSLVGSRLTDTGVRQSSSLDSSYFRAAAAARFLDRPYFNTEFSHAAPNRYRHERGLYFSSYAALQDWDALTPLGTMVRLEPGPFLRFDDALDPISRANEALGMLIYLRRDVKTAPHSVALELRNGEMFPKHYLSAIGDDYAKLSLVTRLGLLYPEIKPLEPVGKASPDLTLKPEEFAYLSVSQWYVSPDNSGGKKSGELFDRLRQAGILPPGNPSDPVKGIYVSETGELALHTKEETMTVITPRLEGAIVKKNLPVTLKRLTVNSCDRPASVAVAALDGEKAIPEATRLLLVFTTNAFNTGQIFDNAEQKVCYESGNHPALIEAAEADLTLDDGRNTLPDVYALHFDGTRAEKLRAERENGKLRLRLNTGKLKHGAAFFEIVYP